MICKNVAFCRALKIFATLLIAASSLFAIAFETERVTESSDDTSVFMRAKLASSQRVIEGLVTEDFTLIKKGAEEMHRISGANRWPKSPDRVYEHYNQSFRKQCEKLMSQTESRNLEAAHYTYLHMTTTCIDCHNYVRGNFRVRRPKDNQGPIQLIPTEWDNPTTRGDGNNARIPARPLKYSRDRN